jgi:hypothetical protein
MNPKHIYLLPEYSNSKNLNEVRGEKIHSSFINIVKDDNKIELRETNGLVEDRYSLNLESYKYEISKEVMIHHHPGKKHSEKHIQFKLKSKNETIRIFLDMLDDEDYNSCVRGFLYLTKDILDSEKEYFDNDIKAYFFNDKIEELKPYKNFLIEKIRLSKNKGMITVDDSRIDDKKFIEYREEPHLKPFFDFE